MDMIRLLLLSYFAIFTATIIVAIIVYNGLQVLLRSILILHLICCCYKHSQILSKIHWLDNHHDSDYENGHYRDHDEEDSC